MMTQNLAHTVETAVFTGDNSHATLFIVIMVIMAVIIIGMVVFSVISSKKNKTTIEVIPKEKQENSDKEE